MLKPLTFYIRNKKKAAVLVLVLVAAVFSVATVVALVQSVFHTSEVMNLSPLSSFSIVQPTGRNTEEAKTALENLENADSMYGVSFTFTSVSTLFGTTSAFIVFPDGADDLSAIFTRCGLVISQGLFPRDGHNELVAHESILLNRDLAIGDSIGDFTIVGSFIGDAILIFGSISRDVDASVGQEAFLVFPQDGNLFALNHEIEQQLQYWTAHTYSIASRRLQDEFSTINLVMSIIIVMVVLSISIAVGALVYTVYSGRYEEFAIINAIGHKKTRIGRLIFAEVSVLAIISWVIGIALSVFALYLINMAIFQDMGQTLQFITARGIYYTLLVPALIITLSVVPVTRRLSKTDLISIIERR